MTKASENDPIETIRQIHKLMDRSAKFSALSGWAGIWPGIVAIAGASMILKTTNIHFMTLNYSPGDIPINYYEAAKTFIFNGLIIFLLAMPGALFFIIRNAHKAGQQAWNHTSRQLLKQFSLPMLTGGLFACVLLFHYLPAFVIPVLLVFYGLSLISCSKFTLPTVGYLGITELALGCLNLFFLPSGPVFWILGFGVAHIVYGLVMLKKTNQ